MENQRELNGKSLGIIISSFSKMESIRSMWNNPVHHDFCYYSPYKNMNKSMELTRLYFSAGVTYIENFYTNRVYDSSYSRK